MIEVEDGTSILVVHRHLRSVCFSLSYCSRITQEGCRQITVLERFISAGGADQGTRGCHVETQRFDANRSTPIIVTGLEDDLLTRRVLLHGVGTDARVRWRQGVERFRVIANGIDVDDEARLVTKDEREASPRLSQVELDRQ